MAKQWTRRQVLAQMGIAAAAVHTLDPHELCCAVPAHAQTAEKDLFELKKVGDGMSKHQLGRYRDRIGQNVEMVHKKVVKKA